MKKKEKKDITPNCSICRSEAREGIEMLGILAASSWRIAARRINATFDTNFSATTVENHMMHHTLHSTAVNAGIVLDAITDDDSPTISPEVMLKQLLVQGALDIARGNMKCRTPDELMRVIQMIVTLQQKNDTALQMENGDAEGFYGAMSAYSEAIKDTCSPEQISEIVTKANSLGAAFNIGNVAESHPINGDVQKCLQQAVEDKRKLGHGRTREELINAGVIDLDKIKLPSGEA